MPRTTAGDVILQILRTNGGQWGGKTKLFKTFYFAHLYYADEHPCLLTDWPIARLPEGPGIDKSFKLFDQLRKDGLIAIEQDHEGPYPEYRYRLTQKGWEWAEPPEDAALAIRKATDYCSEKTAHALSQITHDMSRSWKHGKDGDILDIYIDLIPDDEYEARQEEIQRLDKQLATIMEGAKG